MFDIYTCLCVYIYIYKIFSYTSHLRCRGLSLLWITHVREDWNKTPDEPWFWIKFKHYPRNPWSFFPVLRQVHDGPRGCRDFPALPSTSSNPKVTSTSHTTLTFWAVQPEPEGCPCQEAPLRPLYCSLSQLRHNLCHCECPVSRQQSEWCS